LREAKIFKGETPDHAEEDLPKTEGSCPDKGIKRFFAAEVPLREKEETRHPPADKGKKKTGLNPGSKKQTIGECLSSGCTYTEKKKANGHDPGPVNKEMSEKKKNLTTLHESRYPTKVESSRYETGGGGMAPPKRWGKGEGLTMSPGEGRTLENLRPPFNGSLMSTSANFCHVDGRCCKEERGPL